jgi:hypothetical protein
VHITSLGYTATYTVPLAMTFANPTFDNFSSNTMIADAAARQQVQVVMQHNRNNNHADCKGAPWQSIHGVQVRLQSAILSICCVGFLMLHSMSHAESINVAWNVISCVGRAAAPPVQQANTSLSESHKNAKQDST